MKKTHLGNSFGFHFGGVYEYKLNERFTFRPELILSFQGDREETDDTYLDANAIDYKLTYLNIPLNLKFFTKPYVIVGPQVGFLLATEKGRKNFGKVKTNLDYGVNFGFGYNLNHSLFMEFSIYQGVATLIKIEKNWGYASETHATNTLIQLSLGYYFN